MRQRYYIGSIVLIVILMILGSKLNSAEKSAAGKPEIKLAIVGQSLIKVDPRKHWIDPFSSVKPIIESADVGFTNFEMAVDNNCGLPDDYQVMLGKPALGSDRPGNTNGPHAVYENVMEFSLFHEF